MEKFSEATVGYRESIEIADTWVQLFSTPYFMVTAVRISFSVVERLKLLPFRIEEFGKNSSHRAWSVTTRLVLKIGP